MTLQSDHSTEIIERLFSIRGRRALVTGGGQGIGRMIAGAFVDAGAKVYIASRKADALAEAAASCLATERACPYRQTCPQPTGAGRLPTRWRDMRTALTSSSTTQARRGALPSKSSTRRRGSACQR